MLLPLLRVPAFEQPCEAVGRAFRANQNEGIRSRIPAPVPLQKSRMNPMDREALNRSSAVNRSNHPRHMLSLERKSVCSFASSQPRVYRLAAESDERET